jgi:hypothetical protein
MIGSISSPLRVSQKDPSVVVVSIAGSVVSGMSRFASVTVAHPAANMRAKEKERILVVVDLIDFIVLNMFKY